MDGHPRFSLPLEKGIMKFLIVNGQLAHLWSNFLPLLLLERLGIFFILQACLISITSVACAPRDQALSITNHQSWITTVTLMISGKSKGSTHTQWPLLNFWGRNLCPLWTSTKVKYHHYIYTNRYLYLGLNLFTRGCLSSENWWIDAGRVSFSLSNIVCEWKWEQLGYAMCSVCTCTMYLTK